MLDGQAEMQQCYKGININSSPVPQVKFSSIEATTDHLLLTSSPSPHTTTNAKFENQLELSNGRPAMIMNGNLK